MEAIKLISKNNYKAQFPTINKNFLFIDEVFHNTIQGEGIYAGTKALFIRLAGCEMGCSFCDSKNAQNIGIPISFTSLFSLLEESNIISELHDRSHLIITGGQPLLQQYSIFHFIYHFEKRYDFKPFIEIENECVIYPFDKLIYKVDCWNNSPKLSNSKLSYTKRIHPKILKKMNSLENSWFKFVVQDEYDWNEIVTTLINPGYINKSKIILMPMGENKEILEKNEEIVFKLASNNSVKFTSREHIKLGLE